MNAGQLEAVFRELAGDKEGGDDGESFAVSKPLFLAFLNEAEQEAAIRKNLLFDNYSEHCLIALQDGLSVYAVDSSVYAITHAVVANADDSDPAPLFITDRLELDSIDRDWRGRSGRPEYLIQHDTFLEFVPSPDADYAVSLEAYVLPRVPMAADDDEPEIHSIHHLKLVDWVLYRAFSIPDIDLTDSNRAGHYLQRFDHYFGRRPDGNRRRNQYANRPHHNQVSPL